MKRNLRSWAALIAALAVLVAGTLITFVGVPSASAQDVNEITRELESRGYYIEPGAEGGTASFADLVRQGDRTGDTWYFVSLAGGVAEDFADDLRDAVSPQGNVLVYFFDGEFVNVQLASSASETIEDRALAPFDGNWEQPEDFMADVISEFESLTAGSGSSTTGGSGDADSGGGFPWLLLAIPVLLIGGFWFMSRRGKKKKAEANLDTAQKIRAELQTELDELANDVLVLSGPVDLSEKTEAVTYYREATDTYLTISDELPDVEKLNQADLRELSELGARVAHARWQMDAAEAIIDGEPVPEKPKVAPPPAPPAQSRPRAEQRRQMPQRQPRRRVPYSPSRRRSGGGLLDILIAGAGMTGSSRGGGMFGSGSRGRTGGGMFGRPRSRSQGRGPTRSTNRPRSGGGVFGSGSRSRPSTRRSGRSSSRSSSRSRSGGRRSTSRRRRR